MIIFNKLTGRLGNNIIQLVNIIHIAIAYKHNIKINVKNPNFFDLTVIQKYFSKYDNSEIITDNYDFFYICKLPFSDDILLQNIEERNKILKEAFLINNIKKLPENDLVIHIRSGDIFGSTPHINYVPPPLCYYTKEIDKYKYEKIHIICEDTINPVVNKLLKLYKNAIYEKNTLEKDIRIILGATNIIYSVGTFIPSLMLLSSNIKNIYGYPVQNFEGLNNIYMKLLPLEKTNIACFEEIKEYYKIMKPWKNTIKQRDYILTYNYN